MDDMTTITDILNVLASFESFYSFDDDMVPPDISIKDVIAISSFISPQIILILGSYVTKVRYSPEDDPDFDLIMLHLRYLFGRTAIYTTKLEIDFRKYVQRQDLIYL